MVAASWLSHLYDYHSLGALIPGWNLLLLSAEASQTILHACHKLMDN